jgi:hypothetical protein
MQTTNDEAVPVVQVRRVTGCELVYRKLFTKEDPLYFHKTFGTLCLLSFLYRYAYVYPRFGNLGFEGSWFDWATMAVHMLLSSSSLIFHVLPRRVLSRPVMIWEEYRLHAIVFTLRCMVIFAIALAAQEGFWRRDRSTLLQFLCVMPLHAVADLITRKFGTPNTTTVRVSNDHCLQTKIILRFYAFYQFLALGAHLTPHARLADLGFNSLIAIQSSAFLMTLVRKGLVETHTHGIVYTLCLFISGFHILHLHNTWDFFLGVVLVFATRLYFGNRVSKFWLWAVFALVQSHFWKGKTLAFNIPSMWQEGGSVGHAPFWMSS